MISQIIKCLYVITLLIFVGLGCSVDQHASKSQETNSPQNINKKVFQKHEQPIIHEVSFESGSKINFKEKASIEQNFNIKLSSLQKQINDKKLPLHPETFLPLPNTPPPQFNDEKWEEFLSNLQPEEQEFLKKMYAHKQFISYDMLAQGLAAVMEKFDELVKEDYAVAVFHNTSLQWVTSIASVYFAKSRLPVAAWEPEDFKPGQSKKLINRAQDLKVDHFLIFCDVEYNGYDLIHILDKLNDNDAMQNKRVTAFIPFVSRYVRKVLKSKLYKRISVELVTTDFKILPTIDFLKLQKENIDESSAPKSDQGLLAKLELHKKDPGIGKFLEYCHKNREKKDESSAAREKEDLLAKLELHKKNPAMAGFVELFYKNCEVIDERFDNPDREAKKIFSSFFSPCEKREADRAKIMSSPTLTYTEWQIPHRTCFFLNQVEKYEEKNKEKIHFLPEIIPPYKNFK